MHRDRALFTRRPYLTIPVIAVLPLSGCFFDQLQRSEESDIQRVEQKQATLQNEQYRSETLKQQEEDLAAELTERQFSLNELNDRVRDINARNGSALADNDSARRRYHDLLGQLHETNERLTLARQVPTISTEDQHDRIASLKAQLKAQLDLLFRRPQL